MKFFLMLLTIWLTLFLVPLDGWSSSTVSCHCFQDRRFDPARPDAVDPYLLANAQNSLLAAVFNLSKKTIVKEKMGGADNDQLWISNAFSQTTGMPADQAVKARNRAGSWSKLFTRMEREGLTSGDEARLFRERIDDPKLAAAIVDEVLHQKLLIEKEAVAEMRSRGAGNREAILATVLGRIGGVPPAELLIGVREGRFTWGELARRFDIEPTRIEERVKGLVQYP